MSTPAWGRSLGALLVAGSIALSVAACGSSSGHSSSGGSNSTTHASSSTTSTTSKASSTTGLGTGDGVIGHITWNATSLKSAEAQNAPNVGHPSPYVVTQKLTKRPKPGGTIWFLDCGDAECEGYIPGLKAAAKQFGWSIHVVNAGLTPTTVEAGVQAAIAGRASAIFDPGDPSTWFAQSAKALAQHHIPVVADAPDSPLGGGIDAELANNADIQKQGSWMADSIYQLGGNQVRAVFADSTTIPLSVIMEKGFATRLHQLCSQCKVATTSILPQDIGGSAMVSQEVSAVRGNSGTTWLVGFAGSFLIGVPAGLSGANLHVNTLSQSGSAVNLNYIKGGQQTADLTSDENQVGWIAMDMVARLVTGQRIPKGEEGQYAPQELHTKLNIPTFSTTTGYIASKSYPQHYEKLWGVK